MTTDPDVTCRTLNEMVIHLSGIVSLELVRTRIVRGHFTSARPTSCGIRPRTRPIRPTCHTSPAVEPGL